MKKYIKAEISGNIESLLLVWGKPSSVEFERTSENEAEITFYNEDYVHFQSLKDTISQIKEISLDHYLYRGYSFTHEDLKDCELMMLSSTTRSGLGLTKSYSNIKKKLSEKVLPFFTESPLDGILVQTGLGEWLFHKEMIDLLEKNNLTKGLSIKHLTIENNDNQDWFWIYSNVNLGIPDRQDRFIDAFKKENYHGEDFCTAIRFKEPSIFVSKDVYNIIRNLPEEKLCSQSYHPYEKLEIDFWPVDLI
jgi:hypothetical protein